MTQFVPKEKAEQLADNAIRTFTDAKLDVVVVGAKNGTMVAIIGADPDYTKAITSMFRLAGFEAHPYCYEDFDPDSTAVA